MKRDIFLRLKVKCYARIVYKNSISISNINLLAIIDFSFQYYFQYYTPTRYSNYRLSKLKNQNFPIFNVKTLWVCRGRKYPQPDKIVKSFYFFFTEWFDEYSECPVSGCHCKCNSHDLDTCRDLPKKSTIEEDLENLELKTE